MTAYALIALSISSWLGFRIYKAIGNIVASHFWSLYFSLSPKRFDIIYNVTEENYDNLKEIFKIKAEHFMFAEAMRAFEDVAREKMNKQVLDEMKLLRDYFKQVALITLLPALLFIPVLGFYVTGLLAGFMIPSLYNVISMRLGGGYASIISMMIAQEAYKYKFNRKISRKYKSRYRLNDQLRSTKTS